jgi:predicted DNA-binding protein (MmcQ/YjbR family)
LALHQREQLIKYCESLPDAAASFPFDETTLVFKRHGKMFALVRLAGDPAVNLKCDPEAAEFLRQAYPEQVTPGYHMHKRHWNTVLLDGSLPWELVAEWTAESHALVGPQRKPRTPAKVEPDA